jgi:hypothetical protein
VLDSSVDPMKIMIYLEYWIKIIDLREVYDMIKEKK